LAPDLRVRADDIERGRRVPLDLVRTMATAGIFRMCVPRALGGGEVAPLTMVRVLEALGEADGSAGWVAMIGCTGGLIAGCLESDAAAEIYGDPTGIAGGVYAPSGKAVPASGGFRVSGRWPFASGVEHCTWLMGGSVITENGAPRLLANGAPDAPL